MRFRATLLIVSCIALFSAADTYAQAWVGILDPGRAIDWTTAGVTGRIPSRTTICATIPPSKSDVAAAIEVALIACPPGQVVYLSPAGTYNLTSNISFVGDSWSGSHAFTLGFVIQTANTIQECTRAGTSGGSPPTWNSTLNGVTTDGTVTWTNRGVPANNGGQVTLRGLGADQTILNSTAKVGGGVVVLGKGNGGAPYLSNSVLLTGGMTKGSTSVSVSKASGISPGMYIAVTELFDPAKHVSVRGDEGNCTYCATWNGGFHGIRDVGQIDRVTAVNGNTLTLEQPLFSSYNESLPDWHASTSYEYGTAINPSARSTHVYVQTNNNTISPYTCTTGTNAPAFPTSGNPQNILNPSSVKDGTCVWTDQGPGTTTLPLATYFTMDSQYSGLESVQVVTNDTGQSDDVDMPLCGNCWVTGSETNYTSAFVLNAFFSYHGTVANNYFSNAYRFTSGTDAVVYLNGFTTGFRVENNILERLHGGVMLNGGSSGNVIGYNYAIGGIDQFTPATFAQEYYEHQAHPFMNLWEGNRGTSTKFDSIHGSNGYATLFREWMDGANQGCFPLGGRATVVCTPSGTYGGTGIKGWWETSPVRLLDITRLASYTNIVGVILGSNTLANNIPQSAVAQAWAVCGGSIVSNCGTNSRGYNTTYDISWGYGNQGDAGGASGSQLPGTDSLVPYNTAFVHGVYTHANSTMIWNPGTTHTLPSSFYYCTTPTSCITPAFFGAQPFPLMGPDVSGLPDGYGYVNKPPAEVCYENVMGGTDSRNSPLVFNASKCYGNSTLADGPDAPKGLIAIVQ